MIPDKLQNRQLTPEYFLSLFDERQRLLSIDNSLMPAFKKEMHRFLPADQMNNMIEKDNLWAFIVYLMEDSGSKLHQNLAA